MIAPTAGRSPPAAKAAQSNPVRDYISYPAASSYQSCPLKYWFHYVQRLTPEFTSSSLAFGGAIHAAIERHYCCLLEGLPPPTIDEMVDVYQHAWERELKANIRFGKNESATELLDLARRMLAVFQANPVSKLDSTLLGVEEEIRAPVIPNAPDLLGRIDLLAVYRNALRIVDFKTARARWNAANIRESAPQMLLYAELVKPLAAQFPGRKLSLEWVVMTKTKSPVVEVHALTPDPGQIARTKAIVSRVWRAIQAGSFYPAPSARNCSACAYSKACSQWEGL